MPKYRSTEGDGEEPHDEHNEKSPLASGADMTLT